MLIAASILIQADMKMWNTFIQMVSFKPTLLSAVAVQMINDGVTNETHT